jgi:hypothetical protein
MKLFLFILLIFTQVFAATVTPTSATSNVGVTIIPRTTTWASLASGDSGAAVEAGYAKSINFQIKGANFTGTTVIVEGSNDGTTYYQLDDIEGTLISKTAAGQMEVRDRPRYIRPRVSIGAASTDVTGVMYITK